MNKNIAQDAVRFLLSKRAKEEIVIGINVRIVITGLALRKLTKKIG